MIFQGIIHYSDKGHGSIYFHGGLKMNGPTGTTKPTGKELLITRTFDAPRELVWQAWTEPERVKKWWGPKLSPLPL